MSRKLPKATEHTFEDIKREAAPDKNTTPPPKAKAKTKSKAKPKPRTTPKAEPAATARQARSEIKSEQPASAPPPTDTVETETSDRLRLSLAREIVERHTTYSAVGGIIPFPLIDTVSVVAVIVKMVQALSGLYKVPFHRDRTRAVVAGIIGGLGQAGAGMVTTVSLMKVVPGTQVVSMAVSSIASAAVTRAMGRAFILHFETGGTALEFDPIALQTFFEKERSRQ